MRISSVALAFLSTFLFTLTALAADAPFAGKFSDGKLTIDLAESSGGYTGTITLGDRHFPASAHSNGHSLDGAFKSGTNDFPFTATLDGDTLSLSTGGKTYTLKQASSPNPLANPEPANPLATGAAPTVGDGPAGYTVEVATDSGKSLVAVKPKITSVQTALEATFPDLATYFGAKPTIGSAYQDAKDPKSGGATFGTNQNGHPIKGIVSCKLRDDGSATIAVIYGRADAPKAEWDKLMSPPAPTDNTAPPAASDSGVPLHSYEFPDGTGSIGLADGWTTKATTAIHAVVITGPADQFVVVGNSVLVQTPDSPTVKMMQQNQAMMKQMQDRNARMGFRGSPPPAMPPTLIAPFTEPLEALKNLFPQYSSKSEFGGGPSFTLDKIISSTDVPTQLNGGKGALIVYDMTRTLKDQSTPFRVQLHLQICPVADTAWMWFATSMQSPAVTYDHDLPIMSAMVKSLNINQDRAKQVGDAENAQMRQMTNQMAQQSQQNLENSARQFQQDQDRRFAVSQQQHNAQMEGYAQHNEQFKADQLQKSRNNADFVETIRGTRTVYDTQTGATGTADLNYVNGVVDSLNQAALDPNRFVQIPLRDEMYPVPTGK